MGKCIRALFPAQGVPVGPLIRAIKAVLIENAQPVEFGQPLVVIG